MPLKFKARELIWMMLPVLLLGGSVWLFPLGRQLIGGPPMGIETGPARLHLGTWTRQKLTVVDIARGLSAKVEVTVWQGGECPAGAGSAETRSVDYPHHLVLAFLRDGKWTTQSIDYVDSPIDFSSVEVPKRATLIYSPRSTQSREIGSYAGQGHKITLKLPMEQIPHDATEVRLQGRLKGYVRCSNSKPPIEIQSPPLNVVLKAPTEMWPTPNVPHKSELRFLSSEQKFWKPTISDPYASDTEVIGKFEFTNKDSYQGHVEHSWIEDRDGKVISSSVSGYLGFGKECSWIFGTYTLKGKAPFILKSWVYTSPDKWPLLVQIPVTGKPSKVAR